MYTILYKCFTLFCQIIREIYRFQVQKKQDVRSWWIERRIAFSMSIFMHLNSKLNIFFKLKVINCLNLIPRILIEKAIILTHTRIYIAFYAEQLLHTTIGKNLAFPIYWGQNDESKKGHNIIVEITFLVEDIWHLNRVTHI